MPPRYRRDFLIQRALQRCEYCHTPLAHLNLSLQVDHIIAIQHRGTDDEGNLAMACTHCNTLKGPNLTSIDPLNNQIVRLFDPRKQNWPDHFLIDDDTIVGISPTGRATVNLLDMNELPLIHLRRTLRLLGNPIGP